MTSPALPPLARVHHAPEAVFAAVATLAVLGANAAVMGLWWWEEQGTDTPARTWLLGAGIALLVTTMLAVMLRHPIARRAAIGALAIAVVVDAIVIGYELSGTTVLAGI